MTATATAASTAVLATVLALAAFGPTPVLALAVLLICALVAAGWPDLLALPSPRGTTSVLVIAGLAAITTVSLNSRQAPSPGTLPLVLTGALLLAFVHQLLRRDGRPRLVESLTGSITGQAVVVLAACWVALPASAAGAAFACVVLASVAAATAVCAINWPLRVTGPLSLLAGAALGWLGSAVAGLLGALGPGDIRSTVAGVVAGIGAGLLSCGWRLHTSRLPTAHRLPAGLALASAPVALAGAGAFVVGRLLLG